MTNDKLLVVKATSHADGLTIRWSLWRCEIHLLRIVLEALDLFKRVVQIRASIIVKQQFAFVT